MPQQRPRVGWKKSDPERVKRVLYLNAQGVERKAIAVRLGTSASNVSMIIREAEKSTSQAGEQSAKGSLRT